MKRLWILILLLTPVFAGGCKTCFLWQLGTDRAPAGPSGVRPALRHALRTVQPLRWLSGTSCPGDSGQRRPAARADAAWPS